MNAAENWIALCDDLDRTTDQFMAALDRVNRRLVSFGRKPLTEDDLASGETAHPPADILPFRALE